MQSASVKLEEAIKALVSFSERREVGPAIRVELAHLAAALIPTKERVTEIEGLYAIDFSDVVDTKIDQAVRLWKAAQTGAIRGQELQAIRSASPLLSTLYVKGLDIERAYKFADNEIEISSWFGTNIDATSGFLRALRSERRSQNRESEWSMVVPMTKQLGNTLNFLAERGIIRGKKILTRSKDNRWVPFRWEWLRDDPDSVLLISYEKKSNNLLQMIKGEWLNCYVHNIINDQLIRHSIPFELYTNVVYKAPPDVIRSKSDFDVIGRFRDTVICVECKSGKLDESRGDFNHIIERTEALRHILGTIGEVDAQFLFFIVYDPEMNSEEEMNHGLDGHDIHPLRTNQVRSVMASTIARTIS